MKNNDRKFIYDTYIREFGTFYEINKRCNRNFILSENKIKESLVRTEQLYKDYIQDIHLSDEEIDRIIKKIESLYYVYQEEGSVILGDYKHDREWYNRLLNEESHEEYYWDRYEKYLITHKTSIPLETINFLRDVTLKNIMSYIGNPNEESKFSVRGLIVGDVQSGKTLNYIGLLTKAADSGYKVIFVLTGTIESLRRQTQQRIEEGFIGFDSAELTAVGVGEGNKTPMALTSRKKDFTKNAYQNTTYKINDASQDVRIFIVKKNASILGKIYECLKKIHITNQYCTINSPMLMIDDEADNASVNTNKPEDDPTKINIYIRKILSLFSRNTYVGFTATPFANVFINYDKEDEMLKDDLFPRDFIYALKPPSTYLGSKKYFFSNNNNVKYINDFDEKIFLMIHNKEFQPKKLFDSAYEAINAFLIANTIRDIRDIGSKNTHRSMLINMSRYTDVQVRIKDIVVEYLDRVKRAVKQTCKYDIEKAIQNSLIKKLKESFDNEYSTIFYNGKDGKYITWQEVFNHLFESIKNVKVVVVNSLKNSEKLEYEEHKKTGLRVIAIGGLALSRGLTLEGLCVSYFYRNTATYDVLMQMGRWFGYREGYSDLCKIYITEKSAGYYKTISEAIERLKFDIDDMSKKNKKPEEYGIRVMKKSTELKITASNKMRNTVTRIEMSTYFGEVFETPYIYRDLGKIDSNIDNTLTFLNELDISQRDYKVSHPYFKNIPKNKVIKLLNNIDIHPNNKTFIPYKIIEFLNSNDFRLNNFDILIMKGDSKRGCFKFSKLGIDIPLVKRNYDIREGDTIIRISAERAHVFGKEDTKHGLTKEQLSHIDKNNIEASTYMIKERNPLLIIYFIDLDNGKEDILVSSKYKFAVAYAVGFPKAEIEINNDGTEYVVPINADFYSLQNNINYEDGADE